MKKGQRPSRHFRKIRTNKGKKIVLVNERVKKSLRKYRNNKPVLREAISGKSLSKVSYMPYPGALSVEEDMKRSILENRGGELDQFIEDAKITQGLKAKDDNFYEEVGVSKLERDFWEGLGYEGFKPEDFTKEDYSKMLDLFKKNRKEEMALTRKTTDRALTNDDVLGVNIRSIRKAASEAREINKLKNSLTLLDPLAKTAGMVDRYDDSKVDKLKKMFGDESINEVNQDTLETRQLFRQVEPQLNKIKSELDVARQNLIKGAKDDKEIASVVVARSALISDFLKKARKLSPGEQVSYFNKLNERQINPEKLEDVKKTVAGIVSKKDFVKRLNNEERIPELSNIIKSVKNELSKEDKNIKVGVVKYNVKELKKELTSAKNKGKPFYEVVANYLTEKNKILLPMDDKGEQEFVPNMLNAKLKAKVLSRIESSFLTPVEKNLKKGSLPGSVKNKLKKAGLVFDSDEFKKEVMSHNKQTPGMYSGSTLFFNHLKERNALSSSSTVDKLKKLPGLIAKIKNPNVKNSLIRDYNNLVVETAKIKEYAILDEKSKDLRAKISGMSRNSKQRKFVESLDPEIVKSYKFYNVFNNKWAGKKIDQRKQTLIEKAQIMNQPMSSIKAKNISQEDAQDLVDKSKGKMPYTVSKKEAQARYDKAKEANVKAKTKKDLLLDELRQLAQGKKQIKKKNKK